MGRFLSLSISFINNYLIKWNWRSANWMTCIEHEKENILFGIFPWCSLLVIQKLWSLSMFQTIFLSHQHGRSALDTSRTLFLLASTQGVSCRLVMNHLIYMYMFSLITPLIYMWVSVCTFMCIYLFSRPSVPAPQLLIFHREYLSWYIVYALLGPWFG